MLSRGAARLNAPVRRAPETEEASRRTGCSTLGRHDLGCGLAAPENFPLL